IAPMAGRRRSLTSSSRARSDHRSRRSSAPATCSRGIRCDDYPLSSPPSRGRQRLLLCKPMTIVYDKLLSLDIPEVVQTYTEKDTILYALGLGLGQDPLNANELPFVYEQSIKLLPTFAVVLGWPGFWARDLDTGIDWVKLVAGEQGLVLHRPLAPRGTVTAKTRVTEVIDKGPGKGALVYSKRVVVDKATGERIATATHTTFCRRDGGCAAPHGARPRGLPTPARAPARAGARRTRPETALISRLRGDPNPLHVAPAVAKAAGFPRPILHGLATFGIAGHAILKSLCGY